MSTGPLHFFVVSDPVARLRCKIVSAQIVADGIKRLILEVSIFATMC